MAQNGLLKMIWREREYSSFVVNFFLSLLAKNVHNGADHAVGQMGAFYLGN